MNNTPKFNEDESIMTIEHPIIGEITLIAKPNKHGECDRCKLRPDFNCTMYSRCSPTERKDGRQIYWALRFKPSLKTQRMWPIDSTVKRGNKIWSLLKGNEECSYQHTITSNIKNLYFKGHLKPGYKPILMIE